jgi:HEAT repeat protein
MTHSREGKTPKRLLILGKAGIGKSTLCQYIAHQWSEGKLWKEKFEAVFWVPLRKLRNVHSAETAASFLFRLCCPIDELFTKDVTVYLKKNSERILLVLDGLDEIALTQDGQQKKIFDELLQFPYWIVTSRPHAAGEVQADDIVENMGYASKTIDLYIHKSCQDKAGAVSRYLRENPILFEFCHIPINLELICAILKQSKGDLFKINSMTSLYESFTSTLIEKRPFLEKIGAFAKDPGRDQLDQVFELLETIAWTKMQEKELVFSLNITHELEQNFSYICRSGFLQGMQDSYSFLHLTFQEFFAARYLVRLLKNAPSEAAELIRGVKFDPRYKVVMWFTAGLLQKAGGGWPIDAFFQVLDSPKDSIGLYETLLKVRCLEECAWNVGRQMFKGYTKEIQAWLGQVKGWWEPLGKYLLEAFEISPQGVKLLFIPQMIATLKNGDRDAKRIAAEALGYIGHIDPDNAIPLLLKAIERKDHLIRGDAVEALGRLGQVDPKKYIPTLLRFCEDKEEFVRAAAAKALGHIGHADFQAVIPALLKMALCEDFTMTYSGPRAAINAFGQLGRIDPQAVTLALLRIALRKQSWTKLYGMWDDLGKDAAKILGQVSQVDPDSVILSLLQHLHDGDNEERFAAAQVLGQVGHMDPQTVIPELIQALEDKDVMVIMGVAEALSELGHLAPQIVIPALIQQVRNVNYVGAISSIAKALGKVGHADPQAVIPVLIPFLTWENYMIKSAVAEALGEVGYADPQTVIPALFQALEDKRLFEGSGESRAAVAEALGRIGHAAPQLIIPALLSALKNQEESWMRRSAAKALGEIGQADPQAVIFSLLQALEDKEDNVKAAAADALGKVGYAAPQIVIPALQKVCQGSFFTFTCYSVTMTAHKALSKFNLAPYLKSYPNTIEYSDSILAGSFD